MSVPSVVEDCPPLARGRANELTARVQQLLREGTGTGAEARGKPVNGPMLVGGLEYDFYFPIYWEIVGIYNHPN